MDKKLKNDLVQILFVIQRMCIISSLNTNQSKQDSLVSQEKGKQAKITVL